MRRDALHLRHFVDPREIVDIDRHRYKVHIISKHLRGVRQDRFIVIKDYDIDAIIAADEKEIKELKRSVETYKHAYEYERDLSWWKRIIRKTPWSNPSERKQDENRN